MVEVHPIHLGTANAYLIANSRGGYLIDAGMPGRADAILEVIAQRGAKELCLIFITHAHIDHYGSAKALRERTGAPIAIHEADADWMAQGKTPVGSGRGRGVLLAALMSVFDPLFRAPSTPPDVRLRDGDSLDVYGLDGRVVHTPGHTPGSSSLVIDDQFAFVGDLLSTQGDPHIQRFFAHDWSKIQESVARILALEPARVYAGHGKKPLSGEKLRASVNS